MKPLFQLSTRSYDEEIIIVRKAMEERETKCNVKNGFLLKEPSGMAGWTFFNLELSDAMLSVIETSGMMINAQGFGFNEQLKNYLGHYLETKGSNCRIKKILCRISPDRRSTWHRRRDCRETYQKIQNSR